MFGDPSADGTSELSGDPSSVAVSTTQLLARMANAEVFVTQLLGCSRGICMSCGAAGWGSGGAAPRTVRRHDLYPRLL
jgi:hypothetical protein